MRNHPIESHSHISKPVDTKAHQTGIHFHGHSINLANQSRNGRGENSTSRDLNIKNIPLGQAIKTRQNQKAMDMKYTLSPFMHISINRETVMNTFMNKRCLKIDEWTSTSFEFCGPKVDRILRHWLTAINRGKQSLVISWLHVNLRHWKVFRWVKDNLRFAAF